MAAKKSTTKKAAKVAAAGERGERAPEATRARLFNTFDGESVELDPLTAFLSQTIELLNAAALHNEAACIRRVFAALATPGGRVDGQTRTHSEAVARMAKIAGGTPDKKRGPKPGEAAQLFGALAETVQDGRSMGISDRTLAYQIASKWARLYGEERRMRDIHAADLDGLADPDAQTFVRNVHRALGYPNTKNLNNAVEQRRSRAHKARRLRKA